MKVEVAVLGSPSIISLGFCDRKAILKKMISEMTISWNKTPWCKEKVELSPGAN